MGAVVLLALPFFWYLVINGPAGITGAGILLAFLVLWLIMCRRQLDGDTQAGAQAGGPAP
jgi:hypothetical protein